MFFDGLHVPSLQLALGQQPSQQISTGNAHPGGHSHVLGLDLLIEEGGDIVLEGQVPVHHGIEDDAARPNVHLSGVVVLLVQHFGWRVARGPAGSLELLVATKEVPQSKIGYFYDSCRLHQDVFRLHVSVRNPVVVQILEAQ